MIDLQNKKNSVQDLSKLDFIPLYEALVRPQLEYGMPASLPNLVADINHLERIQRLVTTDNWHSSLPLR